jgi:hypothetical protein
MGVWLPMQTGKASNLLLMCPSKAQPQRQVSSQVHQLMAGIFGKYALPTRPIISRIRIALTRQPKRRIPAALLYPLRSSPPRLTALPYASDSKGSCRDRPSSRLDRPSSRLTVYYQLPAALCSLPPIEGVQRLQTLRRRPIWRLEVDVFTVRQCLG